MLNFSEVQGAIFDLDDTLLDNGPVNSPELWLHSRSRLAAIYEAAQTHDIPVLSEVTETENGRAFITAKEHSLIGAIWNVFYMKGLVSNADVDSTTALYATALQIAARKDELHEVILRDYAVEVPGASRFVKNLAAQGLASNLALATSAIKRDVDIFLDKYELHSEFPDRRITSHEKFTHPKPDPECFDLGFQSLDLPEDARPYVLAFEDNPRGIQSAKAAGLFVCAITTRLQRNDPRLLEVEPDLIADSYEEFNRLLRIPTT